MDQKLVFFCILYLLCPIAFVFSDISGNHHDSYSFTLHNQTIVFSASGDLLNVNISYNDGNVVRLNRSFGSGKLPLLRIRAQNTPVEHSSIPAPSASFSQYQSDSTMSFRFSSIPFSSDISLTKEYVFNKNDYSLRFSCQFEGNGFDSSQKNFSPELQFTFSDKIQPKGKLTFLGKKVKSLHPDKLGIDTIKSSIWAGIHDRFWCCLIKPDSNLPVIYRDNSLILKLSSDKAQLSSFRIYYGPIVPDELNKVDHNLTKLLYPLPFWMRWLSFGFLYIFNFLLKLLHNVPVSLILLSVCVKIILAPLFKIASIWQKQVNRQSSILQPRLEEIKKRFKGEEQTRKTLELYKELDISPLYSLKSLLSAAIQIPVFFAAYHMLSEHIALSNSSFLWISDLSSPDHLFKLPFSIPLFGNHFSILPFIMTFFTIASTWLHTDSSLSISLQQKQRANLYWMAALFFLLLYTSPAGMVIYWTMNNILAFMTSIIEFRLQQSKNKRDNNALKKE